MNSFITCQTEIHERTTPKTFARAKQLHRWIPLQE
jgi:hypothetical protein